MISLKATVYSYTYKYLVRQNVLAYSPLQCNLMVSHIYYKPLRYTETASWSQILQYNINV